MKRKQVLAKYKDNKELDKYELIEVSSVFRFWDEANDKAKDLEDERWELEDIFPANMHEFTLTGIDLRCLEDGSYTIVAPNRACADRALHNYTDRLYKDAEQTGKGYFKMLADSLNEGHIDSKHPTAPWDCVQIFDRDGDIVFEDPIAVPEYGDLFQ